MYIYPTDIRYVGWDRRNIYMLIINVRLKCGYAFANFGLHTFLFSKPKKKQYFSLVTSK